MMNTNYLRTRVCGVCVQDEKILLVKHRRFSSNNHFPDESWILPGGGINFGESVVQALQREILEETGYKSRVERFLFLKELIFPFPDSNLTAEHHSLSLAFLCTITGGSLMTGYDPEHGENQLILESNWISIADIDHHVLYPNFLTEFLKQGIRTNFSGDSGQFFESHL